MSQAQPREPNIYSQGNSSHVVSHVALQTCYSNSLPGSASEHFFADWALQSAKKSWKRKNQVLDAHVLNSLIKFSGWSPGSPPCQTQANTHWCDRWCGKTRCKHITRAQSPATSRVGRPPILGMVALSSRCGQQSPMGQTRRPPHGRLLPRYQNPRKNNTSTLTREVSGATLPNKNRTSGPPHEGRPVVVKTR